MHVYVRTTYDKMCSAKIRSTPGGKVSGPLARWWRRGCSSGVICENHLVGSEFWVSGHTHNHLSNIRQDIRRGSLQKLSFWRNFMPNLWLALHPVCIFIFASQPSYTPWDLISSTPSDHIYRARCFFTQYVKRIERKIIRKMMLRLACSQAGRGGEGVEPKIKKVIHQPETGRAINSYGYACGYKKRKKVNVCCDCRIQYHGTCDTWYL